ncbi:ATP-binding cassette domain-containing protein [Streptomyces sp. NPDC002537]
MSRGSNSGKDKADSPSRVMLAEVAASLRDKRRLLLPLLLWSLVEAVPAFLTGQLVTHAVDSGFAADRPLAGMAWLGLLGATVCAGAWGTRQVYPRLAHIVEPFRDGLLRRVVGNSLHRAADGRPADTAGIARLTQQVEIAREAYAGLVMVTRGFVFTVGGALLGMLWLAPPLLVLVLPPLCLGLAGFLLLAGKVAARQRRLMLADEELSEALTAASGGLRDIVACGAEDEFRASLGRLVDAQALAGRRLAWMATVRIGAVAVGGWTPLLLVVAAAPWLLRHGMTAGGIMGGLAYVTQGLLPALRTLVQGLGGSGIRLSVALHRICETGAPRSPGPGAPRRPTTPAAHRGRCDLLLHEVTFKYGARSDPVIDNLSMAIPHGEHLAVVGPSGIGKSTLTNLIAGMLAPDSGRVLLGGSPTTALDPQALARCRVLIPQEAYVFSGSLEENLTYLRPEASPEDLDRAIAALGMADLVTRLGGHRGHVLPTALSAGERQQVALARAYLSPAPLVVLDEATCHLDPGAEARAEEAFARRPGSLVVVAHRMSSALRARRVLVLDGTRATSGSHTDLLTTSPLYRDLVGHWNDDHRMRSGT